MIPLSLGKQKKITWSQVHCHREIATSCPITTLASSHALNKENVEYLLVDMLVNNLFSWQELAVDDLLLIDKCNQHDF